jgi:ribosomal protein S18 acetylase RimI-like enzyme
MNGSSDPELLRRLVEFELALDRDSSESVMEFDWGRLIYNPAEAAMWSSNYLEVRSTQLNAAALVALADELQGSRGIDHRDVVPVDPSHGERLVPEFDALDGWETQRSLYMLLRRPPDREALPAKEVPHAAVEAVRRAVGEDDPNFTQEAVEEQLIRGARLERLGHGRWFAAPADGPPAASCVLYERDGVAQVETVETVPEHRGQGLARAVVMAAANASREAGHELTFIVADADDWPWKLYEKLGFDRVGEFCSFLRKPPQLREPSP